jgi:hypothetical protein
VTWHDEGALYLANAFVVSAAISDGPVAVATPVELTLIAVGPLSVMGAGTAQKFTTGIARTYRRAPL